MQLEKENSKQNVQCTKIIRGLIAISFIFFICLLLYLPISLPSLLFLNTSASLPRGIYLKIPCMVYKNGDFVVYEPTNCVKNIALINGWSKENQFFIKTIGAMPHDHYAIDQERNFSINGKYIGKVAVQNTDGVQLPQLYGEFEVPEGEFLPVTIHPRSFDGRYTGTVPLKAIKAKVVPIFIEF